jgi:glycosyltransferase involved in cell wall biosynthesis
MMGQPFISFIIPARNEEEIIGACLDAIGKLNYDRGLYECVLVDNGSVDKTAEIARAKGATVFTAPEVTVSTLRNLGAKKSRGDFLAFIDADCVVDQDWLRRALEHFQDLTVACVGSYPSIPEHCSWVQEAWALQNRTRANSSEEVDWLASMNILVRRNAFVDIGGFNDSLATCEDVDFCYRLRRKKYRIISDQGIKAIHYGEARTVSDFFRKERWRGQSNLQGLLSHGFYWAEIPSLLLPIFYAVILAGLPITMIYFVRGVHIPLLLNAAFILLPSLLMSLRRSRDIHDFLRLFQLAFLYFVYSLARTAAVFSRRQADRHTAAAQIAP